MMSTPIEKPAKKRLKWLWIIVGSLLGLFVLLIVVGLIVGPSETEPTSSEETTAASPEPSEEPTTTAPTTAPPSPTPTSAQPTSEPMTKPPTTEAPEPTEEPTTEPEARGPRCLDADAAAERIAQGLLEGVTYNGEAAAVKSEDYNSAFMVAMSLTTADGPDEVGVYVVGDLKDGTIIHSADAVSALYADWPQEINASQGLAFSAADDGVAESKACLG